MINGRPLINIMPAVIATSLMAIIRVHLKIYFLECTTIDGLS